MCCDRLKNVFLFDSPLIFFLRNGNFRKTILWHYFLDLRLSRIVVQADEMQSIIVCKPIVIILLIVQSLLVQLETFYSKRAN